MMGTPPGAQCQDLDDTKSPNLNPMADVFAAELSARLENVLDKPSLSCEGKSPMGALMDMANRSPDTQYEDLYENPSSMETQGDALGHHSDPPSVGSTEDPIDADLRNSPEAYVVPEPTYPTILPLFGPLPDPSNRDFDPFNNDDNMTGNMFDSEPSNYDSGDVSSSTAEPGVCGLQNLGNTCFMNSGLQCVIATPTISNFFLRLASNNVILDTKNNVDHHLQLTQNFGDLIQMIYSGKYSVLSPTSFKENLGKSHSQFKGTRQHDSQEFIALLLDSVHEQLVTLQPINKGPMSECTSMELHTPHSTEASCDGKDSVFTFAETGKMIETRDADSVSDLDRTNNGHDLESVSDLDRRGGGDLEREGLGSRNEVGDGSESRGSASPKSYTSHSSLEDKIPPNIRMAPIPESIKTNWNGGSRASLASLDSHNTESDLDLVDEDSVGMATSNLLSNDQLKKNQVRFSDTNQTLGPETDVRNNAVSPHNVDIEDFYKDHKTLNVNMSEPVNGNEDLNNKINFDSEKYRHGYLDNTRPSQTIENLNNPENPLCEKNTNVKRSIAAKMTNTDFTNESIENMDGEEWKGEKRRRLESTEKNLVMETERREAENNDDGQSEPPSCCLEASRDPARLKQAIDADRCWEKFLSANSTVLAHSFQGQYKNTIICNNCGYMSVAFEPFNFLTLELPRALDRQLEVTVLRATHTPVTYCITLAKHDKVIDLRQEAGDLMPGVDLNNILLAEVLRHKINKRLEDNSMLRYVNDTNRKIYAIEVLTICADTIDERLEDITQTASITECDVEIVNDEYNAASPTEGAMGPSSLSSSRSDLDSARTSTTVSSSTSTGTLTETVTEQGWKSCAICLEDMMDSDLLTHIHCSCVICKGCLISAQKHQADSDGSGKSEKCPVCLAEAPSDEWLQVDMAEGVKPPLRILTLTVVSRVEGGGDKVVLFGHPRVIKVPNMVKVEAIHQLLAGEQLEDRWRLCLVDETGEECARCGKGIRCRGCDVNQLADETGDLLLKPGDCLALHYISVEKNRLEEVNRARLDPSMYLDRAKSNLSLYDCLEAFSNPEELDEDNPWFCPMCRSCQPATKTLSVWRYPDFLIIHLKRFIYVKKDDIGCQKVDNRVDFPLEGLDMTPYLAGPLQQGGEQFQLYATVNHSGGPGGGHYTAYACHPIHNTWHLFNDSSVSKEAPVCENQNLAYVLFYKRSGSEYSMSMPDFPIPPKHEKVKESDVAMEEPRSPKSTHSV